MRSKKNENKLLYDKVLLVNTDLYGRIYENDPNSTAKTISFQQNLRHQSFIDAKSYKRIFHNVPSIIHST